MSRILELPLIAATPENIAPFGELVGVDRGRPTSRTRFYDDAVELVEKPHFISDADTCLSVARVRPRALEVIWMERHFKHTQAFLPLNGQPYAVVVAPPSEAELPDLAAVKAFSFDGDCGFLMHLGTWHEFPFALAQPLDLVVILRNETNRNLDAIADGEAVGEDLQKRHVGKRFDVTLRITRQSVGA